MVEMWLRTIWTDETSVERGGGERRRWIIRGTRYTDPRWRHSKWARKLIHLILPKSIRKVSQMM